MLKWKVKVVDGCSKAAVLQKAQGTLEIFKGKMNWRSSASLKDLSIKVSEDFGLAFCRRHGP